MKAKEMRLKESLIPCPGELLCNFSLFMKNSKNKPDSTRQCLIKLSNYFGESVKMKILNSKVVCES